MRLEPDCYGCLLNQILKAFQLLKPETPRKTIISAQNKLMELLLQVNPDDPDSSIIGKKVYEILSQAIDNDDPYNEIKKANNQHALEYYDEFYEIINNSDDPLLKAIVVSALGNTLDPASQHDIDLVNDIKNFDIENLVINDYDEFKESINKASKILLILDNCGEIVFDKLLILTIKNLYPKLEVICAVREGPIINDATLTDAEELGLTEICKVITSPATPGIVISLASEEFKSYFYNKNCLILSKGQGNFEGLFHMPLLENEIYYLLKAKCPLMERIFNVKMDDLIFKKKVNGF
ncbi:MAG: DUF89 domain-containing protein [Promethearchaeota archaeon]